MKRLISLMLAIVMVFGMLPVGEIVAFAEDDKSYVKEIDIIKNFNKEKNVEEIIVKTIGENLDKSTVHIDIGGNKSYLLKADNNSTNTFRQYVLSAKEIESLGGIGKEIIVTDDNNGTNRYDIGDLSMPTVKSTIPPNGKIKTKEEITIIGDRLDKIGDGIKSYLKPQGTPIEIVKSDVKNGNIVKKLGTEVDSYDVVFEQKETTNLDDHKETQKSVKIKREHYYLDVFSVYGELDITDDITMTPSQGAPGSTVTLEATNLTDNMSVFFKKNGDDLYDIKNIGEYVSSSGGTGKDKYIFKVPSLPQGSYEVFLTNKVNKGQDPNKIVNSSKTFKNNIFIIISDGNKPSISQILDKPSGPATGADRTITGRYLGSVSPNVFKLTTDIKPTLDPNGTVKDPEGIAKDALVVTYKNDGETKIGEYSLIKKGKDNKSVDVLSLERKVTGYIGNDIQFREGSKLNPQGSDSIEIKILPVTDEATDPVKDVTLEMETTIVYQYEDENGEIIIDGKKFKRETITTKEIVVKEEGFTFEQLSYKPEITTITPYQIPVEGVDSYKTSLDMNIAIYGKNFSVYRYVEDGVVKYKYPEINIGNQIILNKNTNPGIDIKVFDKNGNIVDGSEGNDLGEKILIKIPKGLPDKGLNSGFIGSNTDTWVVNPNRNNDPEEMGLRNDSPGVVRFVSVEDGKTPNISTISPDTVTTDGQKGVVITGQKFFPGVKVYIDGEEIKNIKRNDTGTEITFDAPPKPEGYYQIIVQNEEGGAATEYPFTYTKTYTDPKILDFNPKKGTAKTLVTVKGQSFVLPNPLVSDLQGIGINKLIGTRIKLGGQDVNIYKGGSNVPNGLHEGYTSPLDDLIIRVKDGKIEGLSGYYHSVILKNGNTYYTIYFDTKSGEIKLSDGDKETYVIGKIGGEPIASLDIKNTGLSIGNKDFTMETPYEVKGNVITGNRVKVINNNELVFEVPPMPREGFYDLTVVNPDTKSDSRTGNSGFYYSFQPDYNPTIGEISPDEGSVNGEYFINISGTGFLDNGLDQKTSVYIGSVKVDSKDIEVSTDGNNLKVKVPKYPGNLENETNMDRKSVVVVVVNPDGGSASKEDGFTYIIPISHPKITKLILNKGTAAGGESVIIEGSEFRFFEPYEDTNNNGEKDDDENFTDINKNGKWDDYRYWRSAEIKAIVDELKKPESKDDYEKYLLPVLPKVYFGGREAEIIDYTQNSIEVRTPQGANGSVDVYLVNNDYGTSNKLKYTYEQSKPTINSIVPNVGRKQGKDKVEILGTNFKNSEINIIEAKDSLEKNKEMPLIQFGDKEKDVNISNKSVPIDALQNSGKIRDRRSTVSVGNITVVYDATDGTNKKLDFTVVEGTGNDKKEYKFSYEKYDDKPIYLPISLLKDKDNKFYDGYEYVRIMLENVVGANSTKRVRVDRGFSPNAELINNNQVSLRTPAYYTVGKTKVTIINPDGGTASGDFEYKNPDSKPTITNILKDGQEGKTETYTENGVNKTRKIVKVNVNGGNTIDIIGTDFRKPVKIKIADLPEISQGIQYEPNNEAISKKMTFTMPKVDDKYVNEIHRVVIENEDGGTAGSDEANPPVYIQFIKGETAGLEILDVEPKAGPSEGGTKVTIKGKDFRKTMDGFEGEELKVYFGKGTNQIRIPSSNIISVSIDKIILTTPPHAPGTVSIKVENPDGSIAEKDNAFTYVSNPKINKIVDPLNNDVIKESLSIEGGETIKIVGNDFLEGPRVIFNPILKKVSENPDLAGERIFINGVEYILESGTPGTDIEFIDSNNIKVKTPSGKLDTGGVIVINSDGAATPLYKIDYKIPEISHPQDVRANLINDEYIRINWNKVTDKATEADGKTVQYEVYAIEGNNRQFIGSTDTTGFVFRDIKPSTTYKFLVRAVGKYGSSKPINESMSNEVTTGRNSGPSDGDGSLGEQTSIDKTGNIANVIIGNDAFSQGNEFLIDLTRGVLVGSEKVVVSIPAKIVVNGKNKTIKIAGKDYSLKFSPNVFENSKLIANKDNMNAGVKFEVTPTNNNLELNQDTGLTILSAKYQLDARAFVASSSDNIENLNGKMNFVLDYDQNMADSRRIKTINLVKYDIYDRRFKEVFGNRSSYGTSVGDINELGTYTITGSRR